MNKKLILGIETSCDETGVAVVENGVKIISSSIASSKEIQSVYGGVFPEQSAREQLKFIIPVMEKALSDAFCTSLKVKQNNYQGEKRKKMAQRYLLKQIDAVSVTVGPGLIGSLLIGVETAKTLSYVFKKPLIAVNHLSGHIYASWLNSSPPVLPAIFLIVSGGHTILGIMKEHGKFKILGETRDDAAGEAFDKIARFLGFSYPGGPFIDKYSQDADPDYLNLPRPMINTNNYDFSFSGLKTAVFRELKKIKDKKNISKVIPHLCASVQEAIVDVLVKKTIDAALKNNISTIIIGGGVAANSRLREKLFRHKGKFFIHIPAANLCTDNGAVIASAAFFSGQEVKWQKITAGPNFKLQDTLKG